MSVDADTTIITMSAEMDTTTAADAVMTMTAEKTTKMATGPIPVNCFSEIKGEYHNGRFTCRSKNRQISLGHKGI